MLSSLVLALAGTPEVLGPSHARPWCIHGSSRIAKKEFAYALDKLQNRHGLVIDVGSFDGSDAMRFARAGYRVWTFEPSPGKVAPIRAKLASGGFDGKVRLYPYALSNTTGTAPFVVNMGGRGAQAMFNGSGSAQDGLGAALWDSSVARVEQVPVRMLDELVPPNESVALLKVDAQGFDFQVLLGAERLLRRGVGVVIAEVSPGLAPGGAAAIAEMIGYMGRLGYRCARCASKGGAAHGDTSANSSSARGGAARPSEEFGAPTAAIPALEWATALADHSKATTYRGVNMGRWSDIVCRRERDQV